MSNIIDFLLRSKNTLLFIFLLAIALFLTVQSHSYQKSKVISSANAVSGKLYAWSNGIDAYFNLKKNNRRLIEENRRLHQALFNSPALQKDSTDRVALDSLGFSSQYTVYNAKVIANNYTTLDNYILLDQGKDDGLKNEMGVITSHGIVGIVENTSAHYARVISILNTNLGINAQLKKSEHYGTLRWKGGSPNEMDLIDIPRLAKVEKGDTIMTNGRSLIFPKGIPIGTVSDYTMDHEENYYHIKVKLFNDMTNIGNVYVIKNNDQHEIDSLKTADEQ